MRIIRNSITSNPGSKEPGFSIDGKKSLCYNGKLKECGDFFIPLEEEVL